METISAGWIIGAVVAILALVLVPPLRALLIWFIKDFGLLKTLLGYIATALYHVWKSHVVVLQNFAPRDRIFMQVNRKRTSRSTEA